MNSLDGLSTRLSPYQKRLVLFTPAVVSLVFFACGGSVGGPGYGQPASTASESPVTKLPPPTDGPLPDAGTGADVTDARVDASEECVLTGGGGSSSGGTSCMTSESYTCTGGPVEIECSCPAAECTCGGKTISAPSACSGGCSVPASVRAQCGALNIVESDGGGSSGWSSSGSTSGSSTSTGGKP